MKLSDVRPGDRFVLSQLPAGGISLQALRLGLAPGSRLFCAFSLPQGPVILYLYRQMIAVGRSLAEKISVEVIL